MTLSPFGLTLSQALTKVGFVPSPQVAQQIAAMQQQQGVPPQDPAAAQQGAPVDPAAQAGAPVDPAAAQAGAAPQDPNAAAAGAPPAGAPPPATLDDVMAGLEQLAQMIQQGFQQVQQSAAAGPGGEQKKLSPKEEMAQLKEQVAQLMQMVGGGGGAPAPAPADPAAAAAPAPAA